MFDFLFGAVVGLIVGWNFLPQPAFIANKVAAIRSKFGF